MPKVMITVSIDQDIVAELHSTRKQRKLSEVVNNLLKEYVGLSKQKTEDLTSQDIDIRISKNIAEAERLRQEKDRREQTEKDKYKNIRFLD